MTSPRLIGLALAAIFALAPASAYAGNAFTLGRGGSPDIVTDNNGTSYVVWDESPAAGEGSSATNQLHFCILPAHGNACSVAQALGESSLASPRVLLDGAGGVLVVSRRAVAGSSPATFETVVFKCTGSPVTCPAAPTAIGRDTDTPVSLNESVLEGSTGLDTLQGSGAGVLFQNSPLDGSGAASAGARARLFEPAGGLALGLSGANPLAVWANAADHQMSFKLGVAGANGNDATKWGALTGIGAGTSPRLAYGSSGLFLASTDPVAQFSTQYEVRQFDGQKFGGPVVLGPAANTTGTADAVVDASGSLHVVFPSAGGLEYRRSDGPPNLAVLSSTHAVKINCGAPAAEMKLGAIAVGPAFDQLGGFVVYGDADGTVKAISTDAVNCETGNPNPVIPTDSTPPTMDIGRRLKLRKGVVSFTLGCPDVEPTCKGSVLITRAGSSNTPLGSLGKAKKFSLTTGQHKTIKFKLSKKGLKKLKKKKTLKIFVIVSASDANGNSGSNQHRALLRYHA